MSVRVDGRVIDIEPAQRGFERYSPEYRASRAASFRLGRNQRSAIGEAFWTHPRCPGVCFPTRADAHRAVIRTLDDKTSR